VHGEKAVAGVHVDYWFLRDEQHVGDSIPVLVAKDDVTKAVSAHLVFEKGNLDWVAARVVEDIDRFWSLCERVYKERPGAGTG